METLLTLKDGTQVSGVLTAIPGDESDYYVLAIAGIPTRFARDNVLRVSELPPVSVRFRQMRDAVDDSDLDARVMLAEWLRERRRYELALREVDEVLKIDGAHTGARKLKSTLELQLEIEADKKARRARREGRPEATAPRPGPDEVDAGGEVGDAEPGAAREFPHLSADQINLIRVMEMDLARPPRLMVPRELIAALIARYPDSELMPRTPEEREALYQARPTQILDLMFRLKARDLYPMVRVLEDPVSLDLFRRDVHQGWLLNSCATSRCHGGEQAGRLFLSRGRPSDPATYYTNFLILDRFRLSDGTPLINYDEPEKSPLIQMALPRQASTRPHPVIRSVRGPAGGAASDQWRPAIRSRDDRRYQQTVAWIQSMYRPRPVHPVTYEPPVPRGLGGLNTPAPAGER